MATVGRQQIGLAALAVVGISVAVVAWTQRDDAGRPGVSPDPSSTGTSVFGGGWGPGGGTSGGSLFDDLEEPNRGQATWPAGAPEPPALLPAVTFTDGTLASVVGIECYPARLGRGAWLGGGGGGGFGPTGELPPEDPTRQVVLVRLFYRDQQRPEDRDRAVRINGQPTRSFRMPGVGGDRGPWGVASLVLDRSVRRVTVDVGVGVGAFEESQRLDLTVPDAAPTPGPATAPAPLRIDSVDGLESERLAVNLVEVRDRDARAASDRSWLLTAILRDGQSIAAGGGPRFGTMGGGNRFGGGGGGDALSMVRVSFRAAPEEVAQIVYRTRPYEWRTIGELDVPPMADAATQPDLGPRRRRGDGGSANEDGPRASAVD